MVHNTQNYWVSGILILENTMFRKLDLFPSSGEGADTYSVRYLEFRAMNKSRNQVILQEHIDYICHYIHQ
jgi:hypothetical protein